MVEEDKVFPDKLIDIIDETAARVKLNNYDKDNVVMTIDDIKKTVFNQTGKILVWWGDNYDEYRSS